MYFASRSMKYFPQTKCKVSFWCQYINHLLNAKCFSKCFSITVSYVGLSILARLSYAQVDLLGYLNVRRLSSVRSSVVNNFLVNTLASNVLAQFFSNLIRVFVLSDDILVELIMGLLGSKSRSLCQILEKIL